MEIVKFGRTKQKVSEGDCVSIKSIYFGEDFENDMKTLGVIDGIIYGRVTEVIDPTRDFTVVWDMDNQRSKHMSIGKVNIEPRDTPKQVITNSLISSDDYQPPEQCSSKTASETHVLLDEFDLPLDDVYFLLENQKACFKAIMYSTTPGTKVHNKVLLDGERKFRIEEVLDNTWEGFDEDLHCKGSFIAWELEKANLCEKEQQQSKSKAKKGKFKVRLKDPQEKEKTESGSRGKKKKCDEKGRAFRRSISQRKKNQEIDDSDDEISNQSTKKCQKKKKVILSAAERRKNKIDDSSEDEIESETDSEVEQQSSSDEEQDQTQKKQKKDSERNAWKRGGWTMDPNQRQPYGPKLNLPDYEILDELSYFFRFLPFDYCKNVILPETNKFGAQRSQFKEITLEDFTKFLGLMYIMEVVKLPFRRMYWESFQDKSTIIPDFNFNKFMSRTRFEEILSCIQLSADSDKDEQITEFLFAVNENFSEALMPGNIVTLDESMIKSFHRNLKGKIKIKRKPRPIGNEIKDMADARSKIAIKLELYEGKDIMGTKEHVAKFGATCATTLRLTEDLHGSGRIVIADSWFGSVKTAIALKDRGLYSVMLVKTAHKRFPRELLDYHNLALGEWVSYTAKLDGVDLQAVSFKDMKKKQFISTCQTIVPGQPRKTKHLGNVNRPKVAEFYLDHAAAIDIHNHVRTGSMGLEDAVLTKSPHLRQFLGILGFIFTNSYLAFKYFKQDQSKLNHAQFKIALANKLVEFKAQENLRCKRIHNESALVESSHTPVKLDHPKPCFYCRHGYQKSERLTTTFACSFCKIPLHKSTYKRKCWELHISKGIPVKRRMVSKK